MKSRVARVPFGAALALHAALSGVACASPDGELLPSMDTSGSEAVLGFCDAAAVVAAKCTRCHSEPPANGAPFSLEGYDAMTAPAPLASNPSRTRADRMRAAVESGEMPYVTLELDPPVEPLSCEERTTLLTWLDAGAPPPADGDFTCSTRDPTLLACDDTL
jgi:uncharacterized membrane protein